MGILTPAAANVPAKVYTFQIPANAAYTLQVVGSYFKLLSQTGAVDVRGNTFGTLEGLLTGQGLRDTPFLGLQFVDKSGAANTIKVLIAGTNFVDDRVAGEVSVIDGGKARTLSNQVFGNRFALGANGAGQWGMLSLYVGSSTQRLIVRTFNVVSGDGSQIIMGTAVGALANDGGAGVSKYQPAAGFPATGQGRIKFAYQGVMPNYSPLGSLVSGVPWNDPEPVVLAPNACLILFTQNSNISITASFSWIEEPNV